MSLFDSPPHSCDVYTRSETTDASGGQVVAYTLRTSGIACLVRAASSSTKMQFQQQNLNVSDVLVSTSTDFLEGDKLITNGETFRVVGIATNQSAGTIRSWTTVYLEQLK